MGRSFAKRPGTITFDEFRNNGITIVNAIAKSVHFYSRGLRSQLRRSRIGFPASSMGFRQCRKRVGLFFERLDPGDVFGEPTHAKWEPARRPEELFSITVLPQQRTGQLHMAGVRTRSPVA